MAELLTLDNLFTLLMLVFLQAVLGFDNLLYISIESKRVEASKQQMVRKVGIALAIVLRIVLLLVVLGAIDAFAEPFTSIHLGGLFEAELSVHALIVIGGGGFILYTAVKEIFHMLSIHELEEGAASRRPVARCGVGWIVAMNLVFSFDSILSAVALTDVVPVMALAIIISGVMMIVLADRVSEFLKKNRMYEVLGLFILFLVGVMLLSEGGHLAHIHLAGHAVEAMPKSTFYFVLIALVIVDIAQGRYQKLDLERQRGQTAAAEPAGEPRRGPQGASGRWSSKATKPMVSRPHFGQPLRQVRAASRAQGGRDRRPRAAWAPEGPLEGLPLGGRGHGVLADDPRIFRGADHLDEGAVDGGGLADEEPVGCGDGPRPEALADEQPAAGAELLAEGVDGRGQPRVARAEAWVAPRHTPRA